MNDAAKWWYYVRQNGASYYPQTVANLGYNVWDWDASKLATLYQDSAKTTPVASNSDPVGAWVDGVQGVDAIQATTANKPTYTTASLNGLPTLSFDGGDRLITANITIGTFAIWAIFKATSGDVVYGQSPYAGTNDGMFLLTNTGTSLQNVVRRTLVNSRFATPINYSAMKLYRIQHDGTNASNVIYQNGVLQTMVDDTINDVGIGTATDLLSIGGQSEGSFALTGNIAHLCIVSPYPTAAIIANMESYINGLWGVY